MTNRITMVVAAASGLLLTASGCIVDATASGSASASASASTSSSSSGSAQTSGGSESTTDTASSRPTGDYERRDTSDQTRPPRETTATEAPSEEVIVVVTDPTEGTDTDDDAPVFGTTDDLSASFTGNLYYLEANTRSLPDLGTMEPVGTVHTRRIDIAPRRFDEGFPGVSERFEWFAIRYTARVHFPSDGTYRFKVNSDDGAILTIDGQEVLNNDGTHAPRSRTGSVELTAGPHDIQLDYFQGPRHQIALQLWWTPPGGEEMIFELAPAAP